MLQFEYLNRQKMGSREELLVHLERFLDEVTGARLGGEALVAHAGSQDGGPCLGIECRNPNWLDRSWFEFLARRNLASVFLQGYYMPPVTAVYGKADGLLRGTTVVRLHGPDREGMEKASGEKWDTIIAPKDAELPGIASMIRDMADARPDRVPEREQPLRGKRPPHDREVCRPRDTVMRHTARRGDRRAASVNPAPAKADSRPVYAHTSGMPFGPGVTG